MISLGGNIGIGLTLRLNNQFSAQASRIAGQFQQMYGNARMAMAQNLQAARQMGTGMAIAGGLASKAFLNATMDAAKFDYALTGIQAVTNTSSAAIEGLKRELMELNIQSIYSGQQLAEGAYELTKSGFSLKQAQQAMKGVSQFGAAGDMTQLGGKEGAAGIMAHTLNTFGLAATQSERVADILAYTANKSSVDLGDIAQSINYVGSEATMLKIPLETVSAMIGVLGNAGIRGTSAGVGLANAISYLGAAVSQFRTKKQADMLKAIGLNPQNLLKANGEMKDMVDIVDIFMSSLSNKKSHDQLTLLRGLLNIRGGRAFTKLFQTPEIGMSFREMQDSILNNAKGTSERIAKMKINTPFGQIEVMQSTLENFRVLLGDILLPFLDKAVKLIIVIVNGLSAFVKTPVGKAAAVLLAGISLATAAAGTFLVVFTSIRLLTMASTVSFGNMGRALSWAWNSAAASAARYAAVAQGASWIGPGGSFAVKGKKGFQTIGKGVASATSGGFLNTIKNFVMQLGKGNGILGRVFGFMRGLGGAAFGLISVFVMIVGFKNIIRGVLYGLGTLVHALAYVYDYVTNLFSHGDVTGQIASENFSRRNKALRQSMGFEEMGVESVARGSANVDKGMQAQGLTELMKANLEQMKKKNQPIIPAPVINLDAKKVNGTMFEHNMRYLESGPGAPTFAQ